MASATARQVIDRAARRINILAAEESLNANEAVDCLQILNDMMFGFGPAGIQYVHTDLAATDTVNVPDEQVRNVTLLLCYELADNFGVNLDAVTAAAIVSAKLELQAYYLQVNPAVPDRSLRRRRMGWFNFSTST